MGGADTVKASNAVPASHPLPKHPPKYLQDFPIPARITSTANEPLNEQQETAHQNNMKTESLLKSLGTIAILALTVLANVPRVFPQSQPVLGIQIYASLSITG